MIDTSLRNWFNNIHASQEDKHEHFMLVIQAQDEVSYGFDKDCNIQYCEDNNIPCFDRQSAGGTIVHAKDCIGINYIYPHSKFPSFLSVDFLNDLTEYFKSKNLNASIDGNDILIDGYKVCSGAENNLPPDFKWCNVVMLISMNQNIDLIRNVCQKEMIKIPKALKDFNIEEEEMMSFIENWFKEKGVNIYE